MFLVLIYQWFIIFCLVRPRLTWAPIDVGLLGPTPIDNPIDTFDGQFLDFTLFIEPIPGHEQISRKVNSVRPRLAGQFYL